MHVAFPCGVMKPEFTMMCKKMEPWVNFISCDIFLQACGGWAGSLQNCGCRSFVLPSQLRFPPSFLTQFCGGRSNVWIICNGGVSTNLNINGEIQIYEIMFNRIPQSALRRKRSDEPQTFSHVKQTKRSDVSDSRCLWFMFSLKKKAAFSERSSCLRRYARKTLVRR